MNSPDTQPGLDPPGFDSRGFDSPGVHSKAYFDLDMPDMSEQEFAASLEAPVELPKFVLDVPAESGSQETAELGGETPPQAEVTELDRAAFSEHPSNAVHQSEGSALGLDEHDWRDQVSAKVSNYRSRKPRKDRYPSLQLQFEGSPLRNQTPPEAAPDASVEIRTWDENPGLQARREIPLVLEATARVLEFPRSAALPARDEELAEPVMARPRIVEAPELLPPPPALGGILIEPDVSEEMDRLPGLDVPLQSSPFSRRVLAGVIDAAVVGIALAAFAYIFFRINGIPPSRITAEATAALLAVLWPAYQYAFLVFSKTTPGLRLAGLEVTRFDGAPASRSLRRWRVLASLLSCAPLGLGYAWCFLDEDQLSWHDRITRTHLGSASRIQKQ